ncbi:MAG: acyl-CoA thioesterase [Gammaproteobacteria bacterium]|nr:acyl-CoA thioesterase [Gammaproteobacteria bacterium]
MKNHFKISVDWGHCDAAEIVYYPNYFRWFDQCTQELLRSVGFDQRTLRAQFGIIGTPIVDASAQFRGAVSYGDQLDTTSHVEKWGRSSFTLYHRLERDGQLAVEGHEVRVWAERPDPNIDQGIRTVEIAAEFKRRLGG